jgi:hypothetical protein
VLLGLLVQEGLLSEEESLYCLHSITDSCLRPLEFPSYHEHSLGSDSRKYNTIDVGTFMSSPQASLPPDKSEEEETEVWPGNSYTSEDIKE